MREKTRIGARVVKRYHPPAPPVAGHDQRRCWLGQIAAAGKAMRQGPGTRPGSVLTYLPHEHKKARSGSSRMTSTMAALFSELGARNLQLLLCFRGCSAMPAR
ncbi:MAG: hypothetical protein E5V33_04070 [Mesorhizobium sp.]|uniref:hypothetical protein n=1 Tax=unclassified Mesorhizobium TaxID=325217 RepID=UPI00121D1AEF|nr:MULTISPECIES: hypothetical protein [unclassified Mesorhizobium]TIX66844.1 MAG: hypothetical protein E5V33_04070 [Mesorhizobium sp.]